MTTTIPERRAPYRDNRGRLRIPMRNVIDGTVVDLADDGNMKRDAQEPMSSRQQIIRNLKARCGDVSLACADVRALAWYLYTPTSTTPKAHGEDGQVAFSDAHHELCRVWDDVAEGALAANLAIKDAKRARAASRSAGFAGHAPALGIPSSIPASMTSEGGTDVLNGFDLKGVAQATRRGASKR